MKAYLGLLQLHFFFPISKADASKGRGWSLGIDVMHLRASLNPACGSRASRGNKGNVSVWPSLLPQIDRQ